MIDQQDANTLPLRALLPIKSVVVTLEFIGTSHPSIFHQAALTAFLKYLLVGENTYDQHIRIDTPESGRVYYRPGDYYRFNIIGLANSDPILQTLIDKLSDLPRSANRKGIELPFRDNLRLVCLNDAFSEQEVQHSSQLTPYTHDDLCDETELWQNEHILYWQWLSPGRLLKEKEQRGKSRGETRFCRDANDINANLLFSRIHDQLCNLIRHRDNRQYQPRQAVEGVASSYKHLFWTDNHYTDKLGKEHVMGGISGNITLELPPNFPTITLQRLILGQYTGIGQLTAFGWGRYRLSTTDNHFSYRRTLPARSMLMQAQQKKNLIKAWRHVTDNNIPPDNPDASEPLLYEDYTFNDDIPIERLEQDLQKCLYGDYQTPELRGHIITKPNGGIRTLAVPPIYDRILQRAIAQVMTPALEKLMDNNSHGFRPGRSRLTARYDIQAAWRQGYRWVYESDIKDFFDSVCLQRLRERLNALYDQDPVVNTIINWMQAPVRYQDQLIQRKNGLPQGSPISPLMANLMLDDFDSDMREQGFKLIRFADDFIILCKSPEEAKMAESAAQYSLHEHGLKLNPDKTRITSMEQGFRYLGYLFVNDMALDVGGQKERNTPPKPPAPNSWLAHLAEHTPHTINQNTSLEQLHQQIKLRQPLPLGERNEEGTMLCITGQSCLITTRNKHLIAHRDDHCIYDLPWNSLQAVILFGNHHITTPAMHTALEHNIPIHFASSMGDYKGTLWSGQPANTGHQLWLQQIACFSESRQALQATKEIVDARLRHIKETLRQRQRPTMAIDQAIKALPFADNLSTIRGHEGQATREYFAQLATILPDEIGFNGRNRRPPKDPFNVLLSLGYTLLYGYSDSIIRSIGLLPWQGFYHQTRGKHAALASDLMEPFRHIVERTALTVILRKEIRTDDFTTNNGTCKMSAEARRKYLALLIARFETPLKAKGDENAEKIFTHIYRQALSVKQWLDSQTQFKAWHIR